MSFKIFTVTKWIDKRDSSYRIATAKETSRRILLNPDRHMSDILVDPNDANKSTFKYFDNPDDRRESYSVISADDSVASIITAADTDFHSKMITINIHKSNNPNKATVATTLPVSCIAYADDYNPLQDTHCWIVYYNAAFKRREVLADLTIDQLEDIAETGTTSTTTTTPAEQ